MERYCELLEQIHKKPGLYIGSPSINNLYMFLQGYQFARRQLNLPLSQQEQTMREFQPWLQRKFSIKSSLSWSQLILQRSNDEREAFEHFFVFVQEFLQCQQAQFPAESVSSELVPA